MAVVETTDVTEAFNAFKDRYKKCVKYRKKFNVIKLQLLIPATWIAWDETLAVFTFTEVVRAGIKFELRTY